MASSGVNLSSNAVNTYNEFKLHKLDDPTANWLTFDFAPSIEDPRTLEVGEKGNGGSDEFRQQLLKKKACFGVVEVETTSGKGQLVLVQWAPDSLPVKPKMMVATAAGAVKSGLSGCDHYHAADDKELTVPAILEHIRK